MALKHGVLTVSLDFELHWGVRDKRRIDDYKDNLLGVRTVLPELLRLFGHHGIHATWATVGFLFFKGLDDLSQNLPKTLPTYTVQKFSPYQHMDDVINTDPLFYFAPELIDLIRSHEGQEIGTHTFSHYYCLENGQTISQFEDDIISAITIADRHGIKLKSLVFPRNQWKADYLPLLSRLGIECFRGNPSSWIYGALDEDSQSLLHRALRLMDAYLDLSGPNTYALEDCLRQKPFNFPASRFLRPYSAKLAPLEGLRLKRIKKAMADAAMGNKIFHIWWHPHNFGTHIDQNLEFLNKILKYYKQLEHQYGMKSLNMKELSLLASPEAGVAHG